MILSILRKHILQLNYLREHSHFFEIHTTKLLSRKMIAVGECLCSGVKYEINVGLARKTQPESSSDISNNKQHECQNNLNYPSSPSQILVCSCSMCRRASGASYLPFAAFPREDVVFVKSESLKIFQSSDVVKRGFCEGCGAQVFMDYDEKHSLWLTLGLIRNLEEVFEKLLGIKHNARRHVIGGVEGSDLNETKTGHKNSIGQLNLRDITYPGCHVFSESRSQMLQKITKALPHKQGYGLYVFDPSEPLSEEFSEKKPQGGGSHEEWKKMFNEK